ncbi:multidrug ABC transporter ATP-binding protein [Aliidiomarina sedimenti]|uniref:Multidrug ABC transporter ATP-binding protein n=1 Tax=Aliidiomarina sedimenti TaxID=1933879 RepID=A0ABY0BYA8_9GAMM|nr:ABC transporter ATP-binding protein [Aliidiomarina sedimenti]RUO29739.1 multidrug ABC transporter ATP-binding protein [Aliidiomarina sedimenti]
MKTILEVKNLSKRYPSGLQALNDVSLSIERGEILALLGPNGAGKTTLISIICGLVNPGSGSVSVDGYDVVRDYRKTRSKIGLVPQELSINMFDTVWNTLRFSRGVFGKPANDDYLEEVLRSLTLWDKRDEQLQSLSGGMKRRVLIAKALAHEPEILFLDEPTAGVDVELRRDMWRLIEKLRRQGVTIILTTHYIEEAEEIADRISIIRGGEIVLTENKDQLMKQLGKKQLILHLQTPVTSLPPEFDDFEIDYDAAAQRLTYTYDSNSQQNRVTEVLGALNRADIMLSDVRTEQTSLEQIFVNLVEARA